MAAGVGPSPPTPNRGRTLADQVADAAALAAARRAGALTGAARPAAATLVPAGDAVDLADREPVFDTASVLAAADRDTVVVRPADLVAAARVPAVLAAAG